jgi:PAS domain S-box-containing protein
MTGEVKNTEIFLRQKNGNIRQMLFSASFVEIDQERYLLTFAHDITQRKQAEEKLRREEQQFRALAEQTPDMIVLINRDIKVTYANPAVERFLGRKKEEIIGSYLFNYPHPDELDLVVDIFTTFFKDTSPNVQRAELRLCDKDGVWHTVDAVGTNLVRDNVAEAVIVNLRDITERQQMENELRASESNFRHSLDESPLGVRISTVEGETIYANKAILDIYEYGSIDELKKTSIKERYAPQSYAEFLERKKKRLKGEFGPLEYAISIVRKNGEIRHLQVFRKEIFWDGKKQAQIIYQDITERKLAEEKLQKTLESLKKAVGTTIQVLVSALEARDPYTSGHQTRSADVACAIAAEMGLSEETIEGIRMAGTIHDIGKLSIPAEILTKPRKLTDLEFSLIQEHPRCGYEMLKDVASPWALAEIVHQHHERMNGSGYPRKLKGNEILLEARILAVADVVEAMASHRPYRPSLGIAAALDEIEKNKGILYDCAVADACLKIFREKGYHLM